MQVKVGLGVKFREFSYYECFSLLEGVDCDGVELLPSSRYLFLNTMSILKLSKQFNVPIISIHAPIYLVPFAPQMLFKNILKLADYFPSADTYIVHISSLLNYFQHNTKKIKTLNIMAKKKGISICYESNPRFFLTKFYPKETYDPGKFGEFCLENELAITLDTSHISSIGGDIIEFYDKYSKNIKVIHLSDFKNGLEHLPLGYGLLPIEKLLKRIKKSKLFPKIILEIIRFPGVSKKKDKEKIIKESIGYARALTS